MLLRDRERAVLPRPSLHVVPDDAPRAPAHDLSRRAYVAGIAAAIVLGGLVRASFVLGSSFPLNDGGMFFVMARDLQAQGYALPEFTSYNGGGIPFAYPPLGFYAAALLDDLTPLTLLDTFRILPLAGSTLTIVAFFLLARSMLPSRLAITVSVMAFALVPHGFLWAISGGGVTRSLGFTFAIMTVRQSVLMYRGGSWRDAALTGLWCALAIVSHLEMAWFAATSCALVFTAYGRSRTGALLTLAAATAAMALSAPWWGQVIAHHGPKPFLAAATTGSTGANPLAPLVPLIQFRPTAEPLFPVIAALGVLGAIACIATRQWFLPLWLVGCAVFDPRAFSTVASVPLALLAGIAVQSVLVPWTSTGFVSNLGGAPDQTDPPGTPRRRAPRWLLPAAGSFAVVYGLLGALLSTPTLLTGMTDAERDAMAWIAHSTPASARVAVVSGDEWESDRTSEWLPALTGRMSVATVQGHEWMSDRDFGDWIRSYDSLQACGQEQANCLEEWSASANGSFDYVYVPRLAPRTERVPDNPLECCAALRAALLRDPGFRTVYDGPGATVFEPRDAAP